MPEKYDISGEIDMIVKNVPYNLEPIEIVRWIYLKLGSIFSYNLKILTEYESVQALPTESTWDGIPFEKSVLKYKKNNKWYYKKRCYTKSRNKH